MVNCDPRLGPERTGYLIMIQGELVIYYRDVKIVKHEEPFLKYSVAALIKALDANSHHFALTFLSRANVISFALFDAREFFADTYITAS